jgi:hypothetical protein
VNVIVRQYATAGAVAGVILIGAGCAGAHYGSQANATTKVTCPAHLKRAVWHPLPAGATWSCLIDDLRRYERSQGHPFMGPGSIMITYPGYSIILDNQGHVVDTS